MSANICLSSRRQDSSGAVLALIAPLRWHFGAERISIVDDSISADADYVANIQRQMECCSVLLVVIGLDWLTVPDARTPRFRSDDSVNAEIEIALKQDKTTVIAVLVDGVTLPDPKQLPPNLRQLSYQRAVQLSHKHWDSDVQVLIHAIERAMTAQAAPDAILPAPRSVFLCYRRDDTPDATGRLHDRLTATFGADRVFMDIDSVPLGTDFVNHVTDQIAKSSALIAMIGKQWLTISDEKQRRRLDRWDDPVRTEIRAALQRWIPVIPVIVQNASMPQAEDLPDDIRLLARRNGIELSTTRWSTDVERLIKELDRVMKPSGGF